eukprot:gene17844-12789_t
MLGFRVSMAMVVLPVSKLANPLVPPRIQGELSPLYPCTSSSASRR